MRGVSCMLLLLGSAAFQTTAAPRLRRSAIRAGELSRNQLRATRRDWLGGTSAAAALAVFGRPGTAAAAGGGAAPAARRSSALCDSAVSSWRRVRDGHAVYLIGTAHISEESAALVRRTMAEVKPSAVMVELDRERLPKGLPPADLLLVDGGQPIAKRPSTTDLAASAGAAVAPPPPPPPPPQQPAVKRGTTSPLAFLRAGVTNAGAGVVGTGLKEMYKSMDDLGFSSGAEFVTAIQEAQASGIPVVLGDQPVKKTLRRLSEALSETDLVAFINAPEPPGFAKLLEENGGGSMGTKEEVGKMVEVLKTRSVVDEITGYLRETAPKLYAALLGERDAYLANSLLSADADGVVAVVGMAHMTGIETRLRAAGFEAAVGRCPR